MKEENKSVLIIQRRMTEYRVSLFEQLRESLKKKNITLTVVYGTPKENEKLRKDDAKLTWGYAIPNRYFNIDNIQLVWQKIPSTILTQQDLIIMPHESSLLMNYYLLFKKRFNRIKLAFWGHGENFQAQSNGFRERIKSWIARQVDWWFGYTELSVQKIIKNGYPKDRITCLNNSIDTNQLRKWKAELRKEEVINLRSSLGFEGERIGIFLGSFHKDKRIKFLLDSCDRIKKILPDFEFLFIGDGLLRTLIQQYVKERSWAHWVGAIHGREKVLHMSLGKIMLNPGLVGLGILDSFALGIPMITTDCKIHSPEIAYLESGRNGIMTPDNVESFVDSVVSLLNDDQLRNKIASACIEDSHRYSLEKMVDNFCEGILKALDSGPHYKN
jgi:glycosyltransferase involved in cell wall biosynthesis